MNSAGTYYFRLTQSMICVMSISLDQLSTLVAVCRTGSFTAAADELKLTQPTVSGQMRSLEHELGYALFVRSGRYLIPTDKARVLAVQVAGHLDCVSHAVEGFPALDQHAPRVMHVAGPADYLAVRVMPLLAGLNASGLEFRFTVGDSQRLLMDLATGRHDLVISTTYPHVKGVSSSPLIDLEYVLVASPRWSSQLDAIAGDPTAIGAHFHGFLWLRTARAWCSRACSGVRCFLRERQIFTWLRLCRVFARWHWRLSMG